jgi:methyl-accepting chemotaxis protein
LAIAAILGVALLLVVGMSLLLGRSIVVPIKAMTAAMRKIAGRRYGNRYPGAGTPR